MKWFFCAFYDYISYVLYAKEVLLLGSYISYYPSRVSYIFAINDKNVPLLHDRKKDQSADKVYELWLDISESDCSAYFRYLLFKATRWVVGAHSPYYRDIIDIFRSSLDRLSVSNIWAIIWTVLNVSKDFLNTLTNERVFYGLIKENIQANINRAVERQENTRIRGIDRPEDLPVSILGSFFYDIYDVDEYTTGYEMKNSQSLLIQGEKHLTTEEKSSYIMKHGLKKDVCTDIFAELAGYVAKGASTDDAIDALFKLITSGRKSGC